METSQEQAGKGNNICLVIDLHAGQISLRQTVLNFRTVFSKYKKLTTSGAQTKLLL